MSFNATFAPDSGGTVSFDLAPGTVGGGRTLRFSERTIPGSVPPEIYIDMAGKMSARLVLPAFFDAADAGNFATLQGYRGLPGTLTSVVGSGAGYLVDVRQTRGEAMGQIWADVEVLLL